MYKKPEAIRSMQSFLFSISLPNFIVKVKIYVKQIKIQVSAVSNFKLT